MSTGAIFGGDIGTFLPSTSTIDVTGLQLLNNIIQNNANGILIASIEPIPLVPNYLVQFNFFYNNSGDPGSGDGQGAFFNNSAGTVMTNVTITDNLFNALETSASINLANVSTALVNYNVMNQDNSIAIFGTNNVTIDHNVSYQATGVTPSFPTNTSTAIYISNNGSTVCTNTNVTNNLIYSATSNGITITGGNSGTTITNNCIVSNTNAGVHITGATNFNITINNNNIEENYIGLLLDPNSYDASTLLNATNNYWNSASGPNYNSMGPGTGDTIVDNNDSSVSVNYSPFLTSAITCISPLALSVTTPKSSVKAGNDVKFDIGLVVNGNFPFDLISFNDALPVPSSNLKWSISKQTPKKFFKLDGPQGSQTLTITDLSAVVSGTYAVRIKGSTKKKDGGYTLTNTATAGVQIGDQVD